MSINRTTSRKLRQLSIALLASALLAIGLGTASAAPTAQQAGQESIPPTPPQDTYRVIGWNDLGMHCLDDTYNTFSILPPYNNLWAQVVREPAGGGEPQVVTSGVTVEYSFVDNTYSAGKVNFWTYAQQLFGLPQPLPPNVGLAGNGLSGSMAVQGSHFKAEGTPITPYTDSQPTVRQPYQLAHLVARQTGTGQILAETTIVAPVSDEMACNNCHHDGGVGGISTGDYRTNILTLHDEEENTNLMGSRPVLCAHCHASPALGTPLQPGIPYLSLAMHAKHAPEDRAAAPASPQPTSDVVSWARSTGLRQPTGAPRSLPVSPDDGTNDCYQCHPGVQTACLRDVMSQAGMWCTNCHGDMNAVGAEGRIPWLDEPRCGSTACHGPQYAENPGMLYRNSTGHGGLYCEACHNSTHAILPSREPRDNMQTIALQGYAGAITECTVCHGLAVPAGEGPHGMACQLSADVDADRDVDVQDILVEASAWQLLPANPLYDLDHDDDVDVRDVMLVAKWFGAVCQA